MTSGDAGRGLFPCFCHRAEALFRHSLLGAGGVSLGSSAAAAGHQRQGPVRHAAQRTGQGPGQIRDYDGRVRLVSKVGPSRAAAERALKAELTSRQAPGGVGAITSATRMVTLADAWIEADHGCSTGTQRTYRSVINKQVKPAFGQLCIREVTPGVVSRALSAIAKSSGPGAAKTARACLSGMFALAIQDGAAAVNPVRDSAAKISAGKRAPRALTLDETSRLVELFRSSDRAAELDLPDLVDWMLATGCRIGEALAPAVRDQRRRQTDPGPRRPDLGGERHRGPRTRRRTGGSTAAEDDRRMAGRGAP